MPDQKLLSLAEAERLFADVKHVTAIYDKLEAECAVDRLQEEYLLLRGLLQDTAKRLRRLREIINRYPVTREEDSELGKIIAACEVPP